MQKLQKAKVFMTGRSQAVRIPLDFRFGTDEVFIRRDLGSSDVILSPTPPEAKSWAEIFAVLDAAGVPGDFLVDREQEPPQERREF